MALGRLHPRIRTWILLGKGELAIESAGSAAVDAIPISGAFVRMVGTDGD